MPELPEVETVRRQLEPYVVGKRIAAIEVFDHRWCAPLLPQELADVVLHKRVIDLQRRGKYLLWRLSHEISLIQHLRMTGVILLQPAALPSHVSARIELRGPDRVPAHHRCAEASGGSRHVGEASRPSRRGERIELLVADQRRFGTASLAFGEIQLEEFFAQRLGLEPFHPHFTAAHLKQLADNRTAPVKAFLLNQKLIAGIGNIYADEALFAAKIHPRLPVNELTVSQCAKLRASIVGVLEAGIAAKGASIEDFKHIDGFKGSFQDRFAVHRRAGEPCPRCGTEIVKIVVGGRGTYVCEHCQRLRPKKRLQGTIKGTSSR